MWCCGVCWLRVSSIQFFDSAMKLELGAPATSVEVLRNIGSGENLNIYMSLPAQVVQTVTSEASYVVSLNTKDKPHSLANMCTSSTCANQECTALCMQWPTASNSCSICCQPTNHSSAPLSALPASHRLAGRCVGVEFVPALNPRQHAVCQFLEVRVYV